MTYPTNAEIDAAVPPGGTPNRGLTNGVLKKLAAGPSISDIEGITAIGQDVLTAASQADARASIGAGTSNLTIGTTADTAAAGNHRHPNATSTTDGFMSKEDKVSLTGILGDPTETTRGAPMEASEADVTAATSSGKMMSPRRALSMIRNAISGATETLRGTLRVGTQTEVNAGTSDAVAVTPKKMMFGFLSSWSSPSGYCFLPSWLGGFGFQWGQISVPNGISQTGSFPLAFPNTCFAVLSEYDTPSIAIPPSTASIPESRTQFSVNAYVQGATNLGLRYIAIGR